MLQPSPAQPFPALVPKVALSHAILTMLNSTSLASPSEGRAPEASLAATDMPHSGAAADAAGADPDARAALSCPTLDIAINDWDALFRAVEDRLRLTVDEQLERGLHDAQATLARALEKSAAGRTRNGGFVAGAPLKR